MVDIEDITFGSVITGVTLLSTIATLGCAANSYACFTGNVFDYDLAAGIIWGVLSLASASTTVLGGYQAVDTFKNGF